jgi:hypothetical protein
MEHLNDQEKLLLDLQKQGHCEVTTEKIDLGDISY